MNCFVILIALIGVTSAQTLTNVTTNEKKSSDAVSALTNPTIVDNNSTAIEFFGPIEEKTKTDNEKGLQKSNIASKGTERNKRYRLRNYNQDPLLSNAQSPNPFLSGAPGSRGSRRPGGGIDPQIAVLLQNPRLRALAEQNPEIAQQILRNPRLLRDPRIANIIRSQLGEGGGGGGGGLLSLLPGGLGAALNPLGIGLGGGQQGNSGYGGQGQNQNNRGGNGGVFGAPRGLDRRPALRNRANEENIGGGYYGNNRNYGNNNNKNNNNNKRNNYNNNNNNNNNNEENSGANDNNEGNEEGQDYDNSGQEGGDEEGQGEEGGEGQEAQDPSQDPANDPDIQQLQNLGGGIGDNFPEGLFPPGLISKEDLAEIRKQQEKQAKDQAEKERQQQLQQGGGIGEQGGGEGQDYDYGNGEGEGNGEEGAQEEGEETPEEGVEEGAQEGGEGGEENTTAYEEPVTTVQPTTPATPPVYRTNNKPNLKYKPEFGGVRQGSVNNPGVEYDEVIDVNTPTATPPTINSAKGRGRPIPPAIPVPAVQYKGQQPVQPYVNPQQGLYPQQPIGGQVYGQPPQYQQPIPYYQQYQPQYIPQQPQQYVPQQPYPQQYVPQQQYVGQQQGQGYPQQQLYQPVPVQQGYLPQQPIYNQYPQNVRGKQQGRRQNQVLRGRPDPNIANHRLNSIPHDDSEDSADYENQSASPNPGFTRPNGRSFQQQPRIFSSSAQNTESSVAFNTTEPSADSNKFNINTNATYDDIRQRTQRLF